MSTETLRYAATMLLAGIGIPVLAALNAQLGNRIGSSAAAATVLFAVAVLAAGATMLLAGGPAPLRLVPAQPTYLLSGLRLQFELRRRCLIQARVQRLIFRDSILQILCPYRNEGRKPWPKDIGSRMSM